MGGSSLAAAQVDAAVEMACAAAPAAVVTKFAFASCNVRLVNKSHAVLRDAAARCRWCCAFVGACYGAAASKHQAAGLHGATC